MKNDADQHMLLVLFNVLPILDQNARIPSPVIYVSRAIPVPILQEQNIEQRKNMVDADSRGHAGSFETADIKAGSDKLPSHRFVSRMILQQRSGRLALQMTFRGDELVGTAIKGKEPKCSYLTKIITCGY